LPKNVSFLNHSVFFHFLSPTHFNMSTPWLMDKNEEEWDADDEDDEDDDYDDEDDDYDDDDDEEEK